MISFVIIFHPSRINNLNQTLRLLRANEQELDELILVCQTQHDEITTPFIHTKQINMGLKTYHKTLMTNVGVKNASNNILVLLDSDRVLPQNYFASTKERLRPGCIATPEKLLRVLDDYTDEDILSGRIETKSEYRHTENKGRYRNLFAGNTMLFKQDYEVLGGYDESFIGYGYADTDMTRKAMNLGFQILWTEAEELHLKHDISVCWNEQIIPLGIFKIMTATNGLRYHFKWKTSIEETLTNLMDEVESQLDQYPDELRMEYLRMKKRFVIL